MTVRPSWVGAPAQSQTRSRAVAPRGRDRRERGVGVLGEPGDQPRHRRIRGHRPEHPRLGAQHRQVAGGVPTQRDRDREIQHDLARVVRRERPPPRPQPGRELLGQATAPRRLDQQRCAGVRHQRLAASDHGQPGTQVLMLHPRSASQLDLMWSRLPTSNRAEQALSRIQGPRVAHQINLDESPRLVISSRRRGGSRRRSRNSRASPGSSAGRPRHRACRITGPPDRRGRAGARPGDRRG